MQLGQQQTIISVLADGARNAKVLDGLRHLLLLPDDFATHDARRHAGEAAASLLRDHCLVQHTLRLIVLVGDGGVLRGHTILALMLLLHLDAAIILTIAVGGERVGERLIMLLCLQLIGEVGDAHDTAVAQ